MRPSISFPSILSLAYGLAQAAIPSYTVPASAPRSAVALQPAPVGVSFEFFAFPSYFTNVTATQQCLQNFKDLTGILPPIRIGGTTQDPAKFDPATAAQVVYTVPTSTAAPLDLTFGPSFLSLAGTYKGSVVLGLNRGRNDIFNTIAAARKAMSSMKNLLAIELGNEPDYYISDGQPIATASGSWSPAVDAESQDNWDVQVGRVISTKNVIQAGNSLIYPPTWGAAELIGTANETARSYVRNYAHHNYPGGSLANLMRHSSIVSNVGKFTLDMAAVNNVGKEYVMGETNSVSGGGAASVSPTFGASLWTLDYALKAAASNIARTYFHHGTIGACYYCWWGRFSMSNPYYGAYMATAAMAGGNSILALDTSNPNTAIYIIYDPHSKPLRAVLYHSAYYDGSGARSTESFILSGLTATSVRSKRLTAKSALSR